MEIDSTVIAYLADSGEYSLPPEVLRLADPHALQHTVRLVRTNGVALGGGSWSATIVNEIDVITPVLP